MYNIQKIMGLAGVHPDEGGRAKRAGNYFGIAMLFAVLWLALQWNLDLQGRLSDEMRDIANLSVWLFFVIETAVLTFLVQDKWRYLRQNWLNLLIIIAGLPLLFFDHGPLVVFLRALRIVLVLSLLVPWVKFMINFLTDNRLDTTIAACVMFLILAGTFITVIDPAFTSVVDGIWWAWVTISTVGYGDMVPESGLGRVFAAVLIFLGLGLFSVITANFSAILMQRKIKYQLDEEKKRLDVLMKVVERIESDDTEVMRLLKKLEQEIAAIRADKNH